MKGRAGLPHPPDVDTNHRPGRSTRSAVGPGGAGTTGRQRTPTQILLPAGLFEGSKANTYHRNCTVHVPKQDDKYFTRCPLYNITAETSNFDNYKSQFKKLNILTSSCFFRLPKGLSGLWVGWAPTPLWPDPSKPRS